MVDKRPESFDDLPDYVKRSDLIQLPVAEVFGSGVLRAAEDLVAALRDLYGDRIVVRLESGRLEVDLLATEDQLAEALQRRQQWWDREHPADAPSTKDGK